jgi:hypothetical protein
MMNSDKERTESSRNKDGYELEPLALHLLVLSGKLKLHRDKAGTYFATEDLAALRARLSS